MRRPPRPGNANPAIAGRHQSRKPVTPCCDLPLIGTKIGDRCRDRLQGGCSQPRQTGERTIGKKIWLVFPVVEGCSGNGLLADDRADLRAAGDGNIGTALGSPGNVASKLAYVAISLIGNQQQSGVWQRCAVPLRAIRRRQELRRVGEPKAPFVFLPAAAKIAPQQRRLRDPEMRSGKFSVQSQCALRAVDRFVELKPMVVKNPEIMITMWIARCKPDRAVAG